MQDPGEERTTHRLEAFSDIVIAFSMAEVGLTLAIPKSLAGLHTMWVSLNAFAFSFVLISIVWWYHHKLFVRYLALNSASIIMNFLLLGSLALAVYFQQVTVQFFSGGIDATTPLRLWLSSLGIMYGMLAAMYAIGIAKWRGSLDSASSHWSISSAYQMAVSAAGLLALAMTLPQNVIGSAAIVVVTAVAVILTDRVALRLSR
jgi:uncharacterized membrane protein